MGVFDPSAIGEVDYPFELDEYRARLDRVRTKMAAEGIDLLYVTTPEAICWLHGYKTSWYRSNSPRRYPQFYGTAIHVDYDRFIHFDHPTEEPVLLKTSISKDNRYFSTREGKPNLEFIIEELSCEGWLHGNVGLEFWSYIPNRAISEMMEQALHNQGSKVVDGSGVMREVRLVKSPKEIAYIEEAVGIADIGQRTIQEECHPGMTELALYGEVLRAMMAAGGEHQALLPIFTTIPVVEGIAMGSGHLMATRKEIQSGEHLCADICGVVNGYHGNVCRGFYIGEPPQKMIEQYKRAGGVYEVIRGELKAGMTIRQINQVLKEYYQSVGLLDAEGWAIGYDLGLSLPPDWVGDFFFDVYDVKYLDREIPENTVTNFESFFNTTLIDTLVWEADRVRTLSQTHEGIIGVGG
jgi:Xaa-Pro aminopeptidase